jgi:hypothetical protein
MYIFEDFNNVLHPDRASKPADPVLGITLSTSSRLLKNLSAAFLVDARDFFAGFWPTRTQYPNEIPWENLQTLALTSRLLNSNTRFSKIRKLLVAAGRAAALMPKLKVMEIWNGGDGYICYFQYINDSGRSRITWESTWCATGLLDYNVTRCWENVARLGQHPHGRLTTKVSQISRRPCLVKTHASTIRCLELRKSVVHLVSDYQQYWEEESQRIR